MSDPLPIIGGMETNETSNQPTLVRADGTTTCCNAYTTIFSDTHTEYCKACLEDVQGTTD
jgi:hypothetical protein